MAADWLSVIHKQCGQPALFVHRHLVAGEVPSERNYRRLDGSVPTAGELMQCGACGSALQFRAHDLRVEHGR